MSVSEVRRDPETARPRDLDPAGLAAVDGLLGARLATHGAVLVDVSLELRPVVTALRDAMAGGKRLRAAFCLWGARGAAGADDVPGAPEAAAALELFHLAALVHDDLMDHSDARRGQPTVHRGFAHEHLAGDRLGDPDEYGAAVAVLVGDLSLTWSDDLLADAVRLSAHGADARAVWSQMRDQVLAGQYLDVLGQTRTASTTAQVRRVLHYKSAKYTVEHPLLLGGTLGGAPAGLLTRYSAFGIQVGEAFQLRDDVLGVFGEPGVTGKPAIDDVREGKRTLLVAYAEERADRVGSEVLRRSLGDPGLDEQGLQEVRDVLRDTGAVARVEERIGELASEALAVLGEMPVEDRVRRGLAALTDACAWRTA